jgi:uncharacterized protein YggU (UPF0235/DUF167 family)
MPAVRTTPTGIELDVWVSPRASKPGLGPLRGERLRAAVSAAPVDGEANEAVRALLAAELGVARGLDALVRGATGRNKTLLVSGDAATLFGRAQALCGEAAADGASTSSGPGPSTSPGPGPSPGPGRRDGTAAAHNTKRKGSKR